MIAGDSRFSNEYCISAYGSYLDEVTDCPAESRGPRQHWLDEIDVRRPVTP